LGGFRVTAITTPVSAALDLARVLNPEQIAAVVHGEGPQLVLAGAGSGKTRVITHRIGWLVRERGVDPGAIAAVTFTNKAAAEMRERVEEQLQLFPLPTFVGTFHRFALTQLRRYGDRVGLRRDFVILDADDQTALVKKALQAEGIAETAFPPRTVLAAISSAKNSLIGVADYEASADEYFTKRVARLYRRYQHLLAEASGVDFDDLIAKAVALLAEHPEVAERVRRRVRYLLVDEYQDTNHAQLRLIQELVGAAGNLTAVGDEDQGIYRWRGADLDNILLFERSFPGATVHKLERNYRSTQNILDASGAVVAHNRGRRGKRLWTATGAGEKLVLYRAADETDEARWVIATLHAARHETPLSGMAVLVRTNAQTRSLEEELLRSAMPYSLVGGVRFYERAEIKDLIAYLRLLRNPRETLALQRVLNQPPRGIGRGTQEMLEQRAAELGTSLWDAIARDEPERYPARAAKALHAFRTLLEGLRRDAEELPLPAVLDRLLERTAYADLYKGKGPEEEARLENIREFLSAAQEFTERLGADPGSDASGGDDQLTAFLDHIALVSDLDGWQGERGVSLMTLHSAKGLEFPLVVVAGIEDGLLPHFNSKADPEIIEEERRLLYVGMTRAEQRLYLTCCRRRRIAGRYQDQQESPFLEEVPAELVHTIESPQLRNSASARSVQSFFGRREAEDAWEEPVSTPLRRGARVRHGGLGQGVVMEIEGSGEDAKITVYFDRAGKRKLLARYANLELL
jgi:DNA helicase II / ATP-dependent DNA helicase PcrA